MIQQGFLYPLDEYVSTLSPQEYRRRVPSPVEPVAYRAGADGKKHYWMIPGQIEVTVLYYRKDLFVAAGLDPARPPGDWAELKACAEKIADPASGRYGLVFATGPQASYGIFPYLCSAGAQAVKQESDGRWVAAFDSPEAVTAYGFVDELMKATVTKNGKTGPIAYRGMDPWAKITDDRVGMYFGSMHSRQFVRENLDVVGVAPVPRGPGGISSAEINAQMMGIFAGVRDKKVRDAAWKYISFLGSDEARKIYTETLVGMGAARTVNPEWLEEFGYQGLARLQSPPLTEIFNQALSQGVPEPYGKNCQFVYSYMTRPMERLYYTNFSGLSPTARDEIIRTVLTKAVQETNEHMLDRLLPEVRAKRNAVAWIVALIAFGTFAGFLWIVFSTWRRSLLRSASPSGRRSVTAALFAFPAIALIVWWQYYPLARGSLMAFQDYNVMGGSPWVGINNFADVLFDARFWLSLKNALYFCVLWMLLGFLPPVLLAVVLQEIRLGRILFRVLFYLPAVVSGVVILFMWRAIYDPSPDGALNRVIGFLGQPAQAWLQDPRLAMICVVFPLAWASLGPASIIYLAALKGIPEELYEASDIDGAGFWSKIRAIVWPYLRPLIVINAVGATIYGFKSADAILAMTGGGPDDATQVVGYEIWQRSFLYLKFGQATAMAWILGFFLLAFTAYQMRVLARVEFRTGRT